MTRKSKTILSTLTILMIFTACSDRTTVCDEKIKSGVSAFQVYQNAVERGFSGSVLVRYRGDILINDAAGFADRESAIPNSTDTISTMGSITKQYTGALILELQQAGLLSVNDKLADHFSNVPLDKADISIHQLLTHSAGFPVSLGADVQPIGRDEYLELAWITPLLFEPGAEYKYSNTGYSIAAAVAEIVTGQSYEVVLNERILTPASIYDTGYVIPDWSDRDIAKGYSKSSTVDAIRLPWAEDGPYWNLRGNGGLLTTTNDMLKWHDALAGGSVLSASSVETLQERHVATNQNGEYYGYGWITEDTPVGDLHWHNGSNGHHFASMLRFSDEDLVVVMLANDLNKASNCLPANLARASSRGLADWVGHL